MKLAARKAQGSRKIVARRAEPTISAGDFARAFDALPVGSIGDDTNPLSLVQLRGELERRLRSSGGRPSLVASEDKWKVGILQEDAPRIKELADIIGTDRYRPSPAQIASLLIHIALDNLNTIEGGVQKLRRNASSIS
jgi:hypothetical protein